MKNSAIAIDLDDTIANSSAIVLDIIRKEYDPDASFGKWKYFNIEKSFGINESNAIGIFRRAWDEPKKIKLVEPSIPKIIDGLRELHKVYIVTATLGDESSFVPWLERNHINFDSIMHVTHSAEKVLLNKKYAIGFYIDDHPLVAESVAAAGKSALLLRKSWNADFSDKDKTKGIVKVRSWKEINDFFTESFDGND
ncbi:MAG: hypothetical protein QXR73_03685 [Candidatus Micrarchaeaceae archaeon]